MMMEYAKSAHQKDPITIKENVIDVLKKNSNMTKNAILALKTSITIINNATDAP